MTFLKKLGMVLAKIGTIAAALGGVALPFLGSGKASQVAGTVVNDLTSMGQRVAEIEAALQGKAGADKLAAVIPLIGNIVATSELVTGQKIQNEALFNTAVKGYAQATVDLLNALHPDGVKTDPSPVKQ